MQSFRLVVDPRFWDTPRTWPPGCRPIVYSPELIMRHAGTLDVPLAWADDVELLLEAHPLVLVVERLYQTILPFPGALRHAA